MECATKGAWEWARTGAGLRGAGYVRARSYSNRCRRRVEGKNGIGG